MPDDFRPVAACVEVDIKGEYNSLPAEMHNILHFQLDHAEPSQGDVDAVLTMVAAWCNSDYKNNFSGDITITEVRAISLFAAVAPFNFVTTSYQGTQNPVDDLAHAPLVLLHGHLSSRHLKGGMYCFAPGGSQPQSGYTVGYWANIIGAINNLATTALLASSPLAVASRDLGVCNRVTSIGHTNRLTMQKRRRVGFGR